MKFPPVEVEELFRHATVLIQSVLSVTSRSLRCRECVAAFRYAALLRDDDVAAAQGQTRVSLAVVGVEETARRCMFLDEQQQLATTPTLGGGDPDAAVALQYPEDEHLAGRPQPRLPLRTPPKSALSHSMRPARRRLLAFSASASTRRHRRKNLSVASGDAGLRKRSR